MCFIFWHPTEGGMLNVQECLLLVVV
jgi:hypothetical protein